VTLVRLLNLASRARFAIDCSPSAALAFLAIVGPDKRTPAPPSQMSSCFIGPGESNCTLAPPFPVLEDAWIGKSVGLARRMAWCFEFVSD
jgi:hypothetical protein